MIYRQGYCLYWDENTALALADTARCKVGTVSDVVRELVDGVLFLRKPQD